VACCISSSAAPRRPVTGRLVELAQAEGWEVCVIATPSGRSFIDQAALEAATGHPVRSQYKQPDEAAVLPPPDAIVVAPATFNTINKWAAGISDTLALGLLTEAIGKRLPLVALPFINAAQAEHPAFQASIDRLRAGRHAAPVQPRCARTPRARHRQPTRRTVPLAVDARGPYSQHGWGRIPRTGPRCSLVTHHRYFYGVPASWFDPREVAEGT
jgi:Flavoprotein